MDNLLKLLKNWDDPDYRGFPEYTKTDTYPYEEITEYKSKVDGAQAKTISPNMRKLFEEYPPTVEGLRTFLDGMNFKNEKKVNLKNPKFYRMEGGSDGHLKYHTELCSDNTKYIMEIGFNAGISAMNFLINAPNSVVVSFDINLHLYCWYSKMFIDAKFPGRHILLCGDSAVTVPSYKQISSTKFDIIFIDGNHTFESAYNDIKNCAELSDNNTVVILDNVAPNMGCGYGPYAAFLEFSRETDVEIIGRQQVGEDAFVVFKYNKSDNSNLGKMFYIEIEKKYAVYQLTKILENNENVGKNLPIILNYFKNYNIEMDDYLIKLLTEYKESRIKN